MKKLFLISLFCLSLSAQPGLTQQTLVSDDFETAGLFTLQIEGAAFRGDFNPVVGLKTGWNIEDAVGVGLDFNLFLPANEQTDLDEDPVYPAAVYGGLFVEPVLWGDNLVHIAIPVSFGWGMLMYLRDWTVAAENDNYLRGFDLFNYFNPGLSLELNLVEKIRLAIGSGWLFVSDLHLENTPADAMDGLNLFISFKFGNY